jgi:chaperone required for assembly of F1-ATPase
LKRFWTCAQAEAVQGGWEVRLDERPLRTPGRSALVVPTEQLAHAIADEWTAAGETVDPRAMPMTGLANAVIDRVVPDCAAFAAGLTRYAEADLACYRAEGPEALVASQQQEWGALLGWARRRFDVDFAVTTGVLHIAQPKPTVDRLAHEVAALDAFRLAGLSPLVTIGGSLVAALAVLEGALTADDAWHAVSIDERWQIEKWGSDLEAEAAMANRRHDFLAAARFLELLGS